MIAWPEERMVDAVRDYVAESALQKRLTAGLLELNPGGDHPLAGAKPVPVTVLEPCACKPDQSFGLVDSRVDVAFAGPGHGSTRECNSVSVELSNDRQVSD